MKKDEFMKFIGCSCLVEGICSSSEVGIISDEQFGIIVGFEGECLRVKFGPGAVYVLDPQSKMTIYNTDGSVGYKSPDLIGH